MMTMKTTCILDLSKLSDENERDLDDDKDEGKDVELEESILGDVTFAETAEATCGGS